MLPLVALVLLGPKLLPMAMSGPMTPLQSKSALLLSKAPITTEGNAEAQGLDPSMENWP